MEHNARSVEQQAQLGGRGRHDHQHGRTGLRCSGRRTTENLR